MGRITKIKSSRLSVLLLDGGKMKKFGIKIKKKTESRSWDEKSRRFWLDDWLGQGTLKHRFPLIFRLAANKRTCVSNCFQQIYNQIHWSWGWSKDPN
ncbi:hypothetical protein HanRHA438_Chr12g0568741 [Helianthus annuus]|nr:hypothetical protein HanHA300_Chr12g0456831 [Helianthus annuus]KAJ0506475.1 hypothetical protein HanHA89_Chr12g0482411 [Helianthus annuus]KAJ0676152.1 hypothetical protein HanLR1_Chr12g0459401 [Helianthus annuus]KAJ0679384.1 hypothetical protein HanOQP8_Chr12g0458791 [Helianthus annuus]KAJ0867925.1 hypothetical protein HanRHA438_Chr12g0568741 [Helianthus annuus]